MRLTDEEVQVARAVLSREASRAIQEGNMTWNAIARDCGWLRQNRKRPLEREGDGQKVRELLGIAKSERAQVRRLTYDSAYALVKAIGLDPVDVGL